ncbi:MAG: hypothetical protein COY40_03755 [Alphaproteobacteria bacterium CG_4_10_14_0_8_um_filter_53_9]|nr:MAG: hypothetical protein COY40_03755 [Alphaproteobacteria bacterium CG_4_10_14_0_8_um_filter_53_9]
MGHRDLALVDFYTGFKCAQQLEVDDLEGVVRAQIKARQTASLPVALAPTESDMAAMKADLELTGTTSHGMGHVTCCGGCTARMRQIWRDVVAEAASVSP